MYVIDEVLLPFLRSLAFFFDNIVYGLIAKVYELLLYLANMDLYSGNVWIQNFVQRIYILLGIFMLFKLAFSILQYLVDPNAFSDSGQGFGKLVTHTMVAVVLLVSVPTIFEKAYELQGWVLKSNVIGQLIMGSDFSSEVANAKSMATDTQFLMYGAFLSVNYEGVQSLSSCKDTPIIGSREMARTGSQGTDGCLSKLNQAISANEDLSTAGISLAKFFKQGSNGENDERDFSSFSGLVSLRLDGQFAFNYMPVISTLAGGYVAFLLLAFCVDIALRIIKLLFLQILAPISIISYMDPKEKSSDSKLGRWAKESVTTYLSLFLRLATIFLAMILIQMIANTVLADGGLPENTVWSDDSIGRPDFAQTMFIYVFLVIGTFMFAKQVPQMIENLFGIKNSGQLSLNPFKSATVGGLIGGAIGSGASAFAGYATARDMGQGVGRSLANGALGFASGGARGMIAGGRSGGKNLIGSASGVAGSTARSVELRGNTNLRDRARARFRNAIGAQSRYETLENRAKKYESIANYAKEMSEHAKGELGKQDQWKMIQADRARIVNAYNNGQMSAAEFQQRYTDYDNQEKTMIEHYINNNITPNGTGTDAKLKSMYKAMTRINDEGKFGYQLDDWSQVSNSKDLANNEALNIRNSNEYENAKAVYDNLLSSQRQSVRKTQGKK